MRKRLWDLAKSRIEIGTILPHGTVTRWRHVKGHSGHKWNDYVEKQADLGRSGARDCGAPEWQDESIPTDADDGDSSTVGDDMPINGGGTVIPLDDIGDGASSNADDPPDSPP